MKIIRITFRNELPAGIKQLINETFINADITHLPKLLLEINEKIKEPTLLMECENSKDICWLYEVKETIYKDTTSIGNLVWAILKTGE